MARNQSISRRELIRFGMGTAAGIVGGGLLPRSALSNERESSTASVFGDPETLGPEQIAQESPGPGGELWRMGATELAEAIRERAASSRQVVQAHLDRIEAVNGSLNAVTLVLDEQALAAAAEADRVIAAGDEVGPLHGVPMTIKENIDLAGSATTQGAAALAQNVASADAPHIANLKKAGAIPIARTNLPDFGLRWHTDSGLHGATLNPWDPSRTPGGSSGGDACALATGMTPLGNGNDYGGSLRFPAQCCGIASIRPTLGRIPFASTTSPGESPMTIQLFAVEGPMARRVRDVRLGLRVKSGRSARDPWWTPAPLSGPALEPPINVAVTVDPGGQGVHPDVADGVRKAAHALEEAGYVVEEVEPPAVSEAADLWIRLVTAEVRRVMLPDIEPILSADARAFLDQAIGTLPELDFDGYLQLIAARNGVARQWSEFAEQYPLVLGPVSTQPPFPVGHDLAGAEANAGILNSMRLVVTVNLLGLPAAAVPVGVANGLPQGVQIIGPRYREDLCLDAAEAIEGELGVLTPIDPRV